MWFLIALYLYVIGGVVAGRAAHAAHHDTVTSALAAVAWPAAPSKWLWNFIGKALGG